MTRESVFGGCRWKVLKLQRHGLGLYQYPRRQDAPLVIDQQHISFEQCLGTNMRCKAGCLGALVLRQEGEFGSLEKFASAAGR